ncbi:MAG: amidohydrolase, partial [Firmicutes bacterium]|nr:amidohydrolase [Bacillota bacterium]
ADTIALEKRVDKIAQGAALMTETEMRKTFVDGTANTVPNTVLEKVLFDNMNQVALPAYTEEDWAFAKAVFETYPRAAKLPGKGAQHDKQIEAFVKEKTDNGSRVINDFVMPFYTSEDFAPGSTDVGDVSWNIPTAQFSAVTWPSRAPGHSWQNVSCGNSPLGDKGVLYAAKVLCAAAIDLFNQPDTIEAAKEELKNRAPEGYTCPVPQGAKLYVID